MWTYHWHVGVHHGVLTETVSAGWGWYLAMVVLIVVYVVVQVWVRR